MTFESAIEQILLAAGYYFGLILLVRLAGKRLAGQTTTFDLLVLISLGVTLQTLALNEGRPSAALFIITVFALHLGFARLTARFTFLRKILREEPKPLVRNGHIIQKALREEGMTEEEVLAALRKLGFSSPDGLEIAVLEETGHISAVPSAKPKSSSGNSNDQAQP